MNTFEQPVVIRMKTINSMCIIVGGITSLYILSVESRSFFTNQDILDKKLVHTFPFSTLLQVVELDFELF